MRGSVSLFFLISLDDPLIKGVQRKNVELGIKERL